MLPILLHLMYQHRSSWNYVNVGFSTYASEHLRSTHQTLFHHNSLVHPPVQQPCEVVSIVEGLFNTRGLLASLIPGVHAALPVQTPECTANQCMRYE
jgi:hypothetical protein